MDIHRAITVDRDLPDLPTYLRRRHDDELAAALDEARSTFIVLTGTSCTGKTRALFEAILSHDELRTWSLVYPRTPGDLLAVAATRPRQGTILWLNETQNHFAGQRGSEAAAALRRILESDDPPIAVGTLWPQHWSRLESDNSSVSGLLTHKTTRVRVADRFSVAEQGAGAALDLRLSIAASKSGPDRAVIQTLTGGPALVESFEHPDDVEDRFATAIMSAAMDAKRFTFRSLYTSAFLEHAGAGYLLGSDRIDPPADWFILGLRRATRPSRFGITALRGRRSAPGPGPADGFELHDYLDQHGLMAREVVTLPDSLWAALAAHTTDPRERLRLVRPALDRMRYDSARSLYGSANDCSVWENLRLMDALIDHGWIAELRAALNRVPDRQLRVWFGDPVMFALRRLEDQRRWHDLEACLRLFARKQIEVEWVYVTLTKVLVRWGRVEEAKALVHEHPSERARSVLVSALASDDNAAEAASFDSGLDNMDWYASHLASLGDIEGLRQSSLVGACEPLFDLRLQRGDVAGALEALMPVPDWPSLSARRIRRWRNRMADKASAALVAFEGLDWAIEQVWNVRNFDATIKVGSGDHLPGVLLVLLADLLAAAGRWDDALDLIGAAPDAHAAWQARQLAKAGRLDRLRALAEGGDVEAKQVLVDLLLSRGEVDDALALLRSDGFQRATVLTKHKRFDELRRRAVVGDEWCCRELVALAQQGRLPDGQVLLQHGLRSDGRAAWPDETG
ncbi:hypothetical protein [Actinokineospora diospyrosa]|uniref:Tetratricopeptide repeat protein n=1 Tax=Actinokineospora diospyrosa TaxID=103728 RepID=A0ABT1IDV6_9PSEU|nr:hypothetical protein [Actinokineospora diospyrosa]MCP2270803.1 hypothetical protein [Actinokineospora diospyrosa]